MTTRNFSATAILAHRRASQALVERGRKFMRDREEFIRDHDCLPSIIMACIAEGARTRDDIVRNVPRFVGHSYPHIAAILDEHTGSVQNRGYWYRDEAKVYHLHFPVKAIDPPVEMRRKRIKNATTAAEPGDSQLTDQPF